MNADKKFLASILKDLMVMSRYLNIGGSLVDGWTAIIKNEEDPEARAFF